MRIGPRYGATQEVMFLPARPERQVGLSHYDFQYTTWTDDRGRFQFDRVVAGPGTVVRVVRSNPNPRGAFSQLPAGRSASRSSRDRRFR